MFYKYFFIPLFLNLVSIEDDVLNYNNHLDYYKPYSVVQIDTGFKYKINQPNFKADPTFKVTAGHGSEMMKSLYLESKELNLKDVTATQIVWHPDWITSAFYLVEAEKLAEKMNTKVISISAAGPDSTPGEEEALKKLVEKDMILIVASGNEGLKDFIYLRSYNLDCLVSVGTKQLQDRSWESNVADVSLKMYKNEFGTSYSTARFGAIALKYRRDFPNENCKQITERLKKDYAW